MRYVLLIAMLSMLIAASVRLSPAGSSMTTQHVALLGLPSSTTAWHGAEAAPADDVQWRRTIDGWQTAPLLPRPNPQAEPIPHPTLWAVLQILLALVICVAVNKKE